jgi:hypothetical protein
MTSIDEVFGEGDHAAGSRIDGWQADAIEFLTELVSVRRQEVFFSRQLEVQHEDRWFHWVTNRALRTLIKQGLLRSEVRTLADRGRVTLMWHHSYRYYRRDAARVVELINEYADPNIGAALGLQAELLVLEGFAKHQFVMRGREARSFGAKLWTRTGHDLDFIFERDGIGYGVEVKNTLGYMPHDELLTKIDMCTALGLRPVFAARMLPRSWVSEVVAARGFALILKYQLYPWAHRELARRVSREFGLPVDAPRSLADGTMERFVRWHTSHPVISDKDSHP